MIRPCDRTCQCGEVSLVESTRGQTSWRHLCLERFECFSCAQEGPDKVDIYDLLKGREGEFFRRDRGRAYSRILSRWFQTNDSDC